ncbi:hypothetical protein [Brevibacillus marinus]|uniref:hypothetical protein n=1 Tax=Brevibacillus marinus TaxID=2496837 RepID=UPI000F83F772|nr:hypothetical protein [Brevibacillus marinus]
MARKKGYAIGKHVGFLLQPGDEKIAEWLNQQENTSLAIKQALLSVINGKESQDPYIEEILWAIKRIEDRLDQGGMVRNDQSSPPATENPNDQVELNRESEQFLNGLLNF